MLKLAMQNRKKQRWSLWDEVDFELIDKSGVSFQTIAETCICLEVRLKSNGCQMCGCGFKLLPTNWLMAARAATGVFLDSR